MKKPALIFNPLNGIRLGPQHHRGVDAWRPPKDTVVLQPDHFPWRYNPWVSGKANLALLRSKSDVESDPYGLGILIPGEDLVAAPMAPPPAPITFAGPEPESFTPAGDPQYGMLYAVLMEAFAQASTGKGKERHANDLAFTDQKIFSINRQLGSVDGILYQVVKKTIESKKLPPDRACAELMGAIVYAAAGILFIRERSL